MFRALLKQSRVACGAIRSRRVRRRLRKSQSWRSLIEEFGPVVDGPGFIMFECPEEAVAPQPAPEPASPAGLRDAEPAAAFQSTKPGEKHGRRAMAESRRAAARKRQQARPIVDQSGSTATDSAFFMFDSAAGADEFDFEEADERDVQMRFLDAIYIPENVVDPETLADVPRDKPGNRTNEVSQEWDRAVAEQAKKKWTRWVQLQEQRAYRQALGFRNNVILAMSFILLIWTGVGIQRKIGEKLHKKAPVIHAAVAGMTPMQRAASVRPQVKLNDSGVLLQVRAGDPRSVLVGYCENAEGSLCEPVELAWGQPRHADVRYGVYRSFYDLRAIEITRDPRTRQWVVGDGKSPVGDFLAHDRSMSRDRVPVSKP